MTKAITAFATLEWLARAGVGLETGVRSLLPSFPFREHRVCIGDLLAHMTGLPNPIPLAWVHSPEAHAASDERGARGARARRSADCDHDDVSGERSLRRPRTTARMVRLGAAFFAPRWVWDGSVGGWTRIARHHVDGPAYGGLLGTAAGTVPFLVRVLAAARGESGDVIREAIIRPRTLANGHPIPIPAVLHVGALGPHRSFYKEVGGAGFHSELRIYAEREAGSVLIANASELDVERVLDHVDTMLLGR
jgi:D-alanyl-D-alanine carboxypeptidase